MLENLTLMLYRHPASFREIGATLYKVGGFGLLAGMFAQLGKLAASAATGMAGQPPVINIAQLLPGVWTWWIPESFAGFVTYSLIAGAGAALAIAAKGVERQLRSW